MRFLKLFIVFLLIPSILLCSGCGNTLRLYTDSKGNLTDKTNGRYYVWCSGSLRAVSIKKDPYAKAEKGYKVYEIADMDPALWLSEDISSSAIPYVYREESVEEPTLRTFEHKAVYITQTEEITIQVGYLDEQETVDKIVSTMLEGENVSTPTNVQNYAFNISSDKYPGLYYVIYFLIGSNGTCYLYDRYQKRCVVSENFLESETQDETDSEAQDTPNEQDIESETELQ